MADEIEIRPGGESDTRDAHGKRPGQQSPLQGRAAFIKNWDWQFVTGLNRGSCERGKAQHGNSSEAHDRVRQRWEDLRPQVLTLGEALDFLLQCHRAAPFLFFNGNTFADVGRTVVDFVFADLPTGRRREVMSAVAHYIAGVLDRQSMIGLVEGLCKAAEFKPGDRVKTLRGSTSGVILKMLGDGRLVWQPDGTKSEVTALPESLLKEK